MKLQFETKKSLITFHIGISKINNSQELQGYIKVRGVGKMSKHLDFIEFPKDHTELKKALKENQEDD